MYHKYSNQPRKLYHILADYNDAYPKRIRADAGYGSKKNYKYCDRNHIAAFIKYPSYEKEQQRQTEKNKFKPIRFKRDENHMPICPAGHTFTIE